MRYGNYFCNIILYPKRLRNLPDFIACMFINKKKTYKQTNISMTRIAVRK